MKKIIIWQIIVGAALVFGVTFQPFAQQSAPGWVQQLKQKNPLEEKIVLQNYEAFINYAQGYLEVTGRAAATQGNSIAQRKILAEDAARTLAYAKLAATVYGVKIREKSTVKDAESGGLIATRDLEESLIKNALILEENSLVEERDGSVVGSVKLGYLLNGPNGLTGFLTRKDVPTKMSNPDKPFVPAEKSAPPLQTYTGLIVNAEGLDVAPALFPKVVADGDNRIVYSAKIVKSSDVLINGSVRYESSVARAKNLKNEGKSFVGDNPLIVKAVKSDSGSSVYISAEDAVKVYAADLKSGFLQQGKVVFVLN